MCVCVEKNQEADGAMKYLDVHHITYTNSHHAYFINTLSELEFRAPISDCRIMSEENAGSNKM